MTRGLTSVCVCVEGCLLSASPFWSGRVQDDPQACWNFARSSESGHPEAEMNYFYGTSNSVKTTYNEKDCREFSTV